MGLTQERHHGELGDTHAAGGCRAARAHTQEKLRSGAKPRRPDRAVYVPRALRAHDTAHDTAHNTVHDIVHDTVHDIEPDIVHDTVHDAVDDARPPESKKTNTSAKCPKSPGSRERSAPGTPRRSADRHFCNVYTPPHLRPQPRDHKPVPSVPNSDSAISFSDNSCNGADESFYIGNYFANGQLGFYAPSLFEFGSDREGGRRADAAREPNMARPDARSDAVDDMTGSSIIGREYAYDKGEDAEADELKRASREINRSSKRIIKQSFDSDVLVISDPVEEAPARRPSGDGDADEPDATPNKKSEAKASLKREENDWDTVFDDSGECLDPSLLDELAGTVGRVHVSRPRASYQQYQAPGAPDAFAHVLEVYDFPSEFDTNDLLALFSDYKEQGFEIKWVDDTHALIVFSSANVAAEVLSAPRALARCRPLHAATLESRNKAKKCAEFLQPYRQRPETCTALARRLVSGALGVRLSTARQERAEERRLITRAREKKRQAALHKEAAWDGSLANTSPANTSLANTSLDA